MAPPPPPHPPPPPPRGQHPRSSSSSSSSSRSGAPPARPFPSLRRQSANVARHFKDDDAARRNPPSNDSHSPSPSPSPSGSDAESPPPLRSEPAANSTMDTFLSYIRVPAAVTSVAVAALSGLLYWKQNEIIYPRNLPPGTRTDVPRPKALPYPNMAGADDLFLDTPDGEKLHTFWLKPGNPAAYAQTGAGTTVVMLHGNAGNMGHRLPIAGVLDQVWPCNIVMLEYRGYGLSTGTPDEKGINVDTQTGLDWIRQHPVLKSTNIVIYGQSIGGAAAIQLVARNQAAGDIKALILENTFLSMRKMIPAALPPAKYLAWMCHQIWPSEDTIPRITCPVLFLSGADDEIVPPAHMKRLHELCTAEHKALHVFPKYNHNNTVSAPGYFEAISDFLADYLLLRE